MTSGQPVNADDILAELTRFFATATAGTTPGPDEDYFALGLVNSLLALKLVTHVERRFGIEVATEDLDLDNFRTMNRVTAFVLRKRTTMDGYPAG
ncbi:MULTISPECIES: phosphopantetheine-binding protein [unclassified Amycolatopsis]|uniref:acyl carrier protein n=1 Tax=unclassified Amycolatopsis TaxID=2618356 RepID=UPI002876C178|nr:MULTISPECIES: phosphopantetheine-binding protein [unclassified Amycolatopsis]MDS0134363.1 acyl carrier protein [Amycolatopsis sp. 505]MDS0148947.1 acyl carrier protein [Amycolatopsis sp. CM201R]